MYVIALYLDAKRLVDMAVLSKMLVTDQTSRPGQCSCWQREYWGTVPDVVEKTDSGMFQSEAIMSYGAV